MALFKSIVGTLSGKLAGTVYSHNKGGTYIRQLTIPVNPTSTRQAFIRSLMSSNSRAWNALTAPQRTAWTSYANANPVINRLGDAIRLSGIAAYNRINQVARDSGAGAQATPPAGVGPASLSSVSGATNAGSIITLPFTATPLPAGARIGVRSTGPGRASQNPNQRQAKLHGYSAAAAASPLVFTLPYAVSAGTTTNLYLSVVDGSGRESPALKVPYTFT